MVRRAWWSSLLLLSGPTLAGSGVHASRTLVVAAAIAWNIGFAYYWSPYYKIGLTPTTNGHGYELNVNESGHQSMLPSDEKEPFYRLPYELFGGSRFERVLIIGAGSGSDTAVGLKYGDVGHIDAVEIDPVIARLGGQYHPEQPFSDPRVTVHVDDGRSFLRKSTDKYDLIIFALPDSLTLTSQFASLRLESFLFTEEADARGARPPDAATGRSSSTTTTARTGCCGSWPGSWRRRSASRRTRSATAAGAARACWSTARAWTALLAQRPDLAAAVPSPIRARNAGAQRGSERHPAADGRPGPAGARQSGQRSEPDAAHAGDRRVAADVPARAGLAVPVHLRAGHGRR